MDNKSLSCFNLSDDITIKNDRYIQRTFGVFEIFFQKPSSITSDGITIFSSEKDINNNIMKLINNLEPLPCGYFIMFLGFDNKKIVLPDFELLQNKNIFFFF